MTSLEATVAAELRAADKALSFFDVLFYDGSALCGHPDPNLAWCLNTALAFMLPKASAEQANELMKRKQFAQAFINSSACSALSPKKRHARSWSSRISVRTSAR